MHRIRRAGRRAFGSDPAIAHIEVVVIGSPSNGADPAISVETAQAVERARGVLADRAAVVPDAPGDRKKVVSVNVSAGRRTVDDLSIDPSVLWLFLCDGAEITRTALLALIDVFDRRPDLDMAYGDAGRRVVDGETVSSSGPKIADRPPGDPVVGDVDLDGPWLLPGFSPDRLLDQFYLGHLVAFRPHRLVSITGESDAGRVRRDKVDGPWSLATVASTVAHLPEPLYTPAPGVGMWGPDRGSGRSRTRLHGRRWPLVSIIIPTNGTSRTLDRGPTRLVDQALRSVLASTYPAIELVVVVTPGAPDDLTRRLTDILAGHGTISGERTLTVVADDRPFNFSNACNRGAIRSRGDVLVFLNDDTEVINPDWLLQLVDHARKPAVGAVGARLLYEDGRVQHSGIWSRGGHPTHRYEAWPGGAAGYRGALRVTQNCLAVTGACLAVERSKFVLVGGFSPAFPNSYNDVDLCLKLWERGYRTIVEPRAELHHFEASTRDPSITDDDLAALHDRWRWRLNLDPFDNPNHTAERSEEWPPPTGYGRVSESMAKRHPPRYWPVVPVGAVSSA